jgi:hypothetical protein
MLGTILALPYFAVAVEIPAEFASAESDTLRFVAAAVLVVAAGFSTTRIGWRSVGSLANRAGLVGGGGVSTETEIRGDVVVLSVGC